MRINGRLAARRQIRDPSERQMPSWTGCIRLSQGDVFLLSQRQPRAFDGRYFGATHSAQVIGKASLLWRL